MHDSFARHLLPIAPLAGALLGGQVLGWHPEMQVGVGASTWATSRAAAIERHPVTMLVFAASATAAVVALAGVAIGVGLFVLTGHEAQFAPSLAVGLFAAAAAVAAVLWTARARGRRSARLALLGSASDAARLRRELAAAGLARSSVVGWIAVGSGDEGDPELRRLGDLASLGEAVDRHGIDSVVYRDGSGPELFEAAADELFPRGVGLIRASELYEALLGFVPLGTVDGRWYRALLHPATRAGSPILKRAIDLVLGAVLLVGFAPLIAIAAAGVKLTDGGPVLYRQRRLGAGGEPFEILKLRSMRVGAEREHGPTWSGEDDRRITPIGGFLRRTHIDELPQLWNVLRGEMTLVGPRPERPEFVEEMERSDAHYSRRLLVRPGLTGWAQLRCGYAGSRRGTAWKLCHDLYYLKYQGPVFDLLILLQTPWSTVADAQFGTRVPAVELISRRTA